MKTRLVLVLVAVSLLSGCYANMRLYPVKGPLAEQSPMPVFNAQITGRANGGDISLTLPDGEAYKSHWNRVKPEAGSGGETTPNAFVADGMSSVWDSVYGPGFYVAHVLGKWYHGAARGTGDRGTVLELEFIQGGEHEESAKGVARDNKGNIYKVVF